MTDVPLPPELKEAYRLCETGMFTDRMVESLTGVVLSVVKGLPRAKPLCSEQDEKLKPSLSESHWTLGSRLRYLRILGNPEVYKDLRVELQWSPAKYRRVESGRFLLTLFDLEKLAKRFNCSIQDLLTGKFN